MVTGMTNDILRRLLTDHPSLEQCSDDIESAFSMMKESFEGGGKLLLCGNGGSAADCEHIAGELMKGFLLKRPLSPEERGPFEALGPMGDILAEKLQGALPCIPLTGCTALSTAFSNDVDPALVFAQQVYGYGRKGDVLLAVSTSGNAVNVQAAACTAKALGLKTVGLTGTAGGRLFELCDVTVRVPEKETYLVQELHLPVYHALCAMLEAAFFSGR